jgi:hypothetical protein
MPTPTFSRHMAQRCCDLLRHTTSSEVREQLLLWAADFNSYARSAQSMTNKRKRLKTHGGSPFTSS